MPNISDDLAAALIEHQVDLVRLSASTQAEVVATLKGLESEITSRLASEKLTDYQSARMQVLLRDVRSAIAETYGSIRDVTAVAYTALTKAEVQIVASIINKTIGVNIVDARLPDQVIAKLTDDTMLNGAPNSAWWERQASDLAFKFERTVRSGMMAGDSLGEIVTKVRGDEESQGVLFQSRRDAEALVRTSVMTVANSAHLEAYKANSDIIRGVQQLSTLDTRTTLICIAYDMMCWDLDGNPIDGTVLPFVNDGGSPDGCPRHWGCRSVIIPLMRPWKDLGLPFDEVPAGTRASMNGQVASALKFGDWFKSLTEAQQNEALGTARATLWRAGKITMADLLDQSGRPLTLDALRAKHGL